MITLAYGYGVALAAFAGVLAAPIFQVQPLMGSNLIIVVFAVVVIGGMGSIMGAIATGFRITSYNVCYTKLLRTCVISSMGPSTTTVRSARCGDNSLV